MNYVSTRGETPPQPFETVLLTGLAPDGGLFVPEVWPVFDRAALTRLQTLSYPELVAAIAEVFVGDTIGDLSGLSAEAYASFEKLVPLTQLDENRWLLELFWGPTLAFKDYALQLLGRFFETALQAREQHAVVLGATSGDTGSAAIEACRDRPSLDVVILHPQGRVSEVQRRQMTTVDSANVHNIAVQGTFDDCQHLVKAMLADPALRRDLGATSVNSINWVRIMAQIAYYFAGALALGAPDREVAFSVPTGNFGNVFAAYAARQMGLPIRSLIIGTNQNNVVTRFVQTGRLSIDAVIPTITPAMDIQVPSNLERLLFDLHGGDGRAVQHAMDHFARHGTLAIDRSVLDRLQHYLTAWWFDERATSRTITETYARTGLLVDPHTAIGIAAAGSAGPDPDVPVVCVGTAHPAKFPDAVEAATGVRPPLPGRLADLMDRTERMTVLPPDQHAVESYVRGIAG